MQSLSTKIRTKTQIVRRACFSAAHAPYLDRRGVGHNYILDAYVEGAVQQKSGMVMAIHELDGMIQEVVTTLDHHFLNQDVPYFLETMPTLENIAHYCFDFLSQIIANKNAQLTNSESALKLSQVRLYETDDLWVDVIGAG